MVADEHRCHTGTSQSTVSEAVSETCRHPYVVLQTNLRSIVGPKRLQAGCSLLGQNEELLRQRFIVEFQFTGNQVLRFDKTLTGLDLEVDQNEHALIRRLEWAIGRLDSRTIMPVLHDVGMNIAACLQSASSIEEVAAVPGKITAVEGELRTHGKPQFGTSKHLAEVLLEARAIDASKCAIINIRPPGDYYEGTDIDAVERKHAINWNGASQDADRNGLEHSESEVDVILDIGDFGWEPSLYVLGQSPLEVVDRCHTLVKTLEGMG